MILYLRHQLKQHRHEKNWNVKLKKKVVRSKNLSDAFSEL